MFIKECDWVLEPGIEENTFPYYEDISDILQKHPMPNKPYLFILKLNPNLHIGGEIGDDFIVTTTNLISSFCRRECFTKIGKYVYICSRRESDYFDNNKLLENLWKCKYQH